MEGTGPFGWTMAVMLALIPLLFVAVLVQVRKQDRWLSLSLLLIPAMIFALLLLFIGAKSTSGGLGLIPPQAAPILLVWGGACLGGGLFVVRERRKDLYGVIEVVVAIATLAAVARSNTPESLPTTAVGFLAGVYIIVGGLTNFTEARQAARNDLAGQGQSAA